MNNKTEFILLLHNRLHYFYFIWEILGPDSADLCIIVLLVLVTSTWLNSLDYSQHLKLGMYVSLFFRSGVKIVSLL